jgi:hypothetical protein
MLRAVRNILHGDLPAKWAGVTDAPHIWRKLPFALLLACLLVFGCFPRLLTEKLRDPVSAIVQMANPVLTRTQQAETVQDEAKTQSVLTSTLRSSAADDGLAATK